MDDQDRKDEAGLPCVGCNYDLRGCEMADRCPECGVPVSRSQHGLLLQYSDERWLRRIHWGLTLLLWCFYLFPVLMLLVIVVVFSPIVLASQWWAGAPSVRAGWGTLGLWVTLHAYLCLGALGIVLLTSQEPRVRFEERLLSTRRGLRLWALFLNPVVVEHYCQGLVVMGMPLLPGHWRSALMDICSIGAVVLLGMFLSELILLRIGDPELAARVRVVSKGLVRALLATTVLRFIMSFVAKSGVVASICSLVGFAAGFACLVYAFSLLSLMRRCRSLVGSARAKG